MVFLATKAALAATIVGIGVTFGALNYLAKQNQENNRGVLGQSRTFEIAIPSKAPAPSFAATVYLPSSSVNGGGFRLFNKQLPPDCDCRIIHECPSFSGASSNSFRLRRSCGFQGFQRKICCDEPQPLFFSTPHPQLALDEMKTAHAQLNPTNCNHQNDDCNCDDQDAENPAPVGSGSGRSELVSEYPTTVSSVTSEKPLSTTEGKWKSSVNLGKPVDVNDYFRDDLKTTTLAPNKAIEAIFMDEEVTTSRTDLTTAADKITQPSERSLSESQTSPTTSTPKKNVTLENVTFPSLTEYFPDEKLASDISNRFAVTTAATPQQTEAAFQSSTEASGDGDETVARDIPKLDASASATPMMMEMTTQVQEITSSLYQIVASTGEQTDNVDKVEPEVKPVEASLPDVTETIVHGSLKGTSVPQSLEFVKSSEATENAENLNAKTTEQSFTTEPTKQNNMDLIISRRPFALNADENLNEEEKQSKNVEEMTTLANNETEVPNFTDSTKSQTDVSSSTPLPAESSTINPEALDDEDEPEFHPRPKANSNETIDAAELTTSRPEQINETTLPHEDVASDMTTKAQSETVPLETSTESGFSARSANAQSQEPAIIVDTTVGKDTTSPVPPVNVADEQTSTPEATTTPNDNSDVGITAGSLNLIEVLTSTSPSTSNEAIEQTTPTDIMEMTTESTTENAPKTNANNMEGLGKSREATPDVSTTPTEKSKKVPEVVGRIEVATDIINLETTTMGQEETTISVSEATTESIKPSKKPKKPKSTVSPDPPTTRPPELIESTIASTEATPEIDSTTLESSTLPVAVTVSKKKIKKIKSVNRSPTISPEVGGDGSSKSDNGTETLDDLIMKFDEELDLSHTTSNPLSVIVNDDVHLEYSPTTTETDYQIYEDSDSPNTTFIPEIDEANIGITTTLSSLDSDTENAASEPITEITKSVRREPDTDKTVVALSSMFSQTKNKVTRVVTAVRSGSEASVRELTTESPVSTTAVNENEMNESLDHTTENVCDDDGEIIAFRSTDKSIEEGLTSGTNATDETTERSAFEKEETTENVEINNSTLVYQEEFRDVISNQDPTTSRSQETMVSSESYGEVSEPEVSSTKELPFDISTEQPITMVTETTVNSNASEVIDFESNSTEFINEATTVTAEIEPVLFDMNDEENENITYGTTSKSVSLTNDISVGERERSDITLDNEHSSLFTLNISESTSATQNVENENVTEFSTERIKETTLKFDDLGENSQLPQNEEETITEEFLGESNEMASTTTTSFANSNHSSIYDEDVDIEFSTSSNAIASEVGSTTLKTKEESTATPFPSSNDITTIHEETKERVTPRSNVYVSEETTPLSFNDEGEEMAKAYSTTTNVLAQDYSENSTAFTMENDGEESTTPFLLVASRSLEMRENIAQQNNLTEIITTMTTPLGQFETTTVLNLHSNENESDTLEDHALRSEMTSKPLSVFVNNEMSLEYESTTTEANFPFFDNSEILNSSMPLQVFINTTETSNETKTTTVKPSDELETASVVYLDKDDDYLESTSTTAPTEVEVTTVENENTSGQPTLNSDGDEKTKETVNDASDDLNDAETTTGTTVEVSISNDTQNAAPKEVNQGDEIASSTYLQEIYDTLFGPSGRSARVNNLGDLKKSDHNLTVGDSSSPKSTTTPEPPFKIEVKVGPYDSRALFSSDTTDQEKKLEDEISNVVSQLLLTTHKNFHLLPNFVECAGARGRTGRRKTKVLQFDTDNYPWMARVGYREPGGVLFPCAGTIITHRYILTSAHCATRKGNRDASVMEVLLEGAKNAAAGMSDQSQYKYKVEEIMVHPNYNKISRENDIALIRLASAIPRFNGTSDVKPICLPFEDGYGVWDSLPGVGDTAYLGGWGYGVKHMAATVEEMEEAAVTIWSNENCTHLYRGDKEKKITSHHICAYGKAEKDACRGDLGGPLMALMTRQKIFFQVGIVSYGPRCGYGVPGVYTKVRDYLTWLLDTMHI